jgi:hypothetical protein
MMNKIRKTMRMKMTAPGSRSTITTRRRRTAAA